MLRTTPSLMQTYARHTVSQIAQTHTHAYSKTQICSVSHSDTPSQEAQAWPTLSSCHSFLSPDPFKLSPNCNFYPTSSYTNIPEGTSQCLPLMTIPPNHETPPPHRHCNKGSAQRAQCGRSCHIGANPTWKGESPQRAELAPESPDSNLDLGIPRMISWD